MKAHIRNKVPKGKFATYHLTRALSLSEVKNIPCKTISCSPSSFGRISKKVKKYLADNRYVITIEKNKGKPLQTSPKKILEAIKLYRSGMSFRKIEKKLGIAKSTCHYLVRKAKKTKIKKGTVIITV